MKTKKTILIVDDMLVNIEAMIDVLRDQYKLMVATGGAQAIALMKKKLPDMVLLDIYMPDVNGFDVLRFMKSRKELADIPVIFVTGENEVSTEEEGLSLGAVDYIKKPFVETIITVKVKNHLELKEHRDNLELLVTERTKQLVAYTAQLEERTQQLAAHTKRLEQLTQQLKSSHDAIIMGMSLMSERHDRITGSHIERIKLFTKILTDKMVEVYPAMLNPEAANLIVQYSPLHDVGKVSISDVILKKTGSLTPEEFETMKSHTLEGGDLLRQVVHLLPDENDKATIHVAIEIAECHHEKFDGSGYPRGLAGESIPLSARIVALADVYDALRSPRQYKKAFTHKETMDIILHGNGRTGPSHFDPAVLHVFTIVEREFDNVSLASYSPKRQGFS